MRCKYLIFIVLIIALSTKVAYSEKIERILIKEAPEDVKVPKVLWDLIENKAVIEKGQIIPRAEYIKSTVDENHFSGVKVNLIEKTKGVLAGQNYELVSTKFGISINLNQFVKSDKGSFYFSIIPNENISSENTKVYFVSNARKRKLDGQIVGGGCTRFYDISSYFFKTLTTKGMEVVVSDNRHISLLAGSFIIASEFEPGVRTITTVQIQDSQHLELLCHSEQEQDSK